MIEPTFNGSFWKKKYWIQIHEFMLILYSFYPIFIFELKNKSFFSQEIYRYYIVMSSPVFQHRWDENTAASGLALACPGFHLFPARMLLICSGLWLYLRSHHKKFGDILTIFVVWPPIFVNTKEFLRNTKENLPLNNFRSHFLQQDPIGLIPSSECCIFIALSINTHNGHIWCHMAIWLYGHILTIWPLSHMAIWY